MNGGETPDERPSEVHVDPLGEGLATKVNKGARIGDERIVREWRKSTRTNCVRVVKSKMEMSESYETSESGPSRTPLRVDNSKTHIDVS